MSDNVWVQRGNQQWASTRALQGTVLSPGLYEFGTNPAGWWLENTADRFHFPFKVYGKDQGIIDRVAMAWRGLDGNLGISLNGTKGTGKTVAAQQIANWAIDQGMPVLVVNHPIPLTTVLQHASEQPMMVLFDEFEKTHKVDDDRDNQQQLLTALDGLARARFPRLFVFTTNNRRLNENLVDRPSRIRYTWEFDRLGDEVIEEVLNDILPSELRDLQPDLVAYLTTRATLSIDVVKAVVNEARLTRQGPAAWERILNLSEMDAKSFNVQALDDEGGPGPMLFDPLRLMHPTYRRQLRMALTPSGSKFVAQEIGTGSTYRFQHQSGGMIQLVRETRDPTVWMCNVQVSALKTWLIDFGKIDAHIGFLPRWMDKRPEGWKPPTWAIALQKGKELTEAQENEKDAWMDSGSVYGGPMAEIPCRITANFEPEPINFKFAY